MRITGLGRRRTTSMVAEKLGKMKTKEKLLTGFGNCLLIILRWLLLATSYENDKELPVYS